MPREHANKSSAQENSIFNQLILLNLNFIYSAKMNLFAPSLVMLLLLCIVQLQGK